MLFETTLYTSCDACVERAVNASENVDVIYFCQGTEAAGVVAVEAGGVLLKSTASFAYCAFTIAIVAEFAFNFGLQLIIHVPTGKVNVAQFFHDADKIGPEI